MKLVSRPTKPKQTKKHLKWLGLAVDIPSGLSTEAADKHSFPSFPIRGLFAYLKSCSLSIRFLIQHTSSNRWLFFLETSRYHLYILPMSPSRSLVSPQKELLCNVCCSSFHSYHPEDIFLDSLFQWPSEFVFVDSTGLQETVFNQLSAQGSMQSQRTEIPFSQYSPEKGLFAYLKSCSQRIRLLIQLASRDRLSLSPDTREANRHHVCILLVIQSKSPVFQKFVLMGHTELQHKRENSYLAIPPGFIAEGDRNTQLTDS